MTVQFDSDSVPDSFDSADFAGAGQFHFRVSALDEGVPSENQSMKVTSEVIGGAPASELGKIHIEYFNHPKADQDPEKKKNTAKRQLIFAIACGVTTEEEIEAARQQGKGPQVDFNLCVDRHFCGELQTEEYQGKVRQKLGYRIFGVRSEQAKGIKLNEVELAKQGDSAADPFDGADSVF